MPVHVVTASSPENMPQAYGDLVLLHGLGNQKFNNRFAKALGKQNRPIKDREAVTMLLYDLKSVWIRKSNLIWVEDVAMLDEIAKQHKPTPMEYSRALSFLGVPEHQLRAKYEDVYQPDHGDSSARLRKAFGYNDDDLSCKIASCFHKLDVAGVIAIQLRAEQGRGDDNSPVTDEELMAAKKSDKYKQLVNEEALNAEAVDKVTDLYNKTQTSLPNKLDVATEMVKLRADMNK